ncbi:Uu.00g117420.m01.CDS01 [Anthostomella pinea]|uniref:Uu.00g117420.m01.CDS01 n=1 Tax=Anthostomella pinea TaxID=933095 RepID=A0AAI8YEI2_9PEZI|nr:Uu.00g117420.m01.CDS01 [Anthostomella pinea]
MSPRVKLAQKHHEKMLPSVNLAQKPHEKNPPPSVNLALKHYEKIPPCVNLAQKHHEKTFSCLEHVQCWFVSATDIGCTNIDHASTSASGTKAFY